VGPVDECLARRIRVAPALRGAERMTYLGAGLGVTPEVGFAGEYAHALQADAHGQVAPAACPGPLVQRHACVAVDDEAAVLCANVTRLAQGRRHARLAFTHV